jgi:DNA-binding MarR family transcriptional regulator
VPSHHNTDLNGKEEQIRQLHLVMESIIVRIKSETRHLEIPYHLAEGHIIVLMMLYRRTKCIASDIVNLLGITSGAVTGLTDKLVSLGLIERFRPEEDRRVVQLNLTEKGKETIETIRDMRLKRVYELVGQLEEQDLTTMIESFQKLLHSLEKN